jgi:crossover junction endodeoxyribonuclease RusA
MEIQFPIEFIVAGTPVSSQVARPATRDEWKDRIRRASAVAIPQPHFASQDRMAITIYNMPAEPMEGDIDNIVKWIVDALSRHI